MPNRDAERALGVLRSARTLTAELSVVRDLPATLDAVVQGVAQLGFHTAVMNLVRSDGDLEVVAICGSDELWAALFGVVERCDSWVRLLAAGEPWGGLVYCSLELARRVAPEMSDFAPPAPADSPAGGWTPSDMLFAPMYDRRGDLLGVLSVDEPHDRRPPGQMQRELLEMYAAHAAVALENARLRQSAADALRSLEREKERFARAFSVAPTGMAMISPIGNGAMVQVNEALCRMLGRTEAELVGADLLDHLHPDDRAAALADCGKERYTAERRYLRADGSVRWFGVSSIEVAPIDGEPGYRLVHTVDITATKSREARLQHDARHDPLTGLANRRALDEALDDRRVRSGGSALLFCDLDDFKRVNDRYGHDVGDRVLVEVGRRLQATARGDDLVARMGGDEFVVLGRELDHISAVRLAHRLSASIGRPMTDIVPGLTISCTVGVAVGGPDADIADLLARADRQLLEIKRSATASGQARGRPRAR